MHGTTWNIEKIACFNWNLGQKIFPILTFNLLTQFFFWFGIVPINDFSAWFSINDIPALCFTKLAFMLKSVSIIWMDLYTEPIIGIQNLSQKRKDRFLTIAEQLTMLCIENIQSFTSETTIFNSRNTIWVSWDSPVLSNMVARNVVAKDITQMRATPNLLLHDRL